MAEKPNPNSESTENLETPEEVTPEETPEEGLEGEETPRETSSEGEEPEPEEGESNIDYKKRYADSTKEAQRLQKELTALKAQGGTSSAEPPSNTELSRSIPEWDSMSPTEQSLMRELVSLKRQVAQSKSSLTSASERLRWQEDFDSLAQKPEFSSLIKKKQEFKSFCEVNPGPSTEVLAKSFLFEEAKILGAKEEKKKLERKGLEKSSGGERVPKGPDLTPEQEDYLRTYKPQEYAKLLKEKKI